MFAYNYLVSLLSSVYVCKIAITKRLRNEASEKKNTFYLGKIGVQD